MTALVRDVRLAVRLLLGAKAWTLVVLRSLALGIGANTALFTAVNGLMSYNVARRTSEIGVRMALGAQRRTVVSMVMSESIRLVAVGIVLGLGAVLWAARFVQTVVYGLSPSDPLTIGAAVTLIAVVTALAGGVPARRASNVNPIEALRQP